MSLKSRLWSVLPGATVAQWPPTKIASMPVVAEWKDGERAGTVKLLTNQLQNWSSLFHCVGWSISLLFQLFWCESSVTCSSKHQADTALLSMGRLDSGSLFALLSFPALLLEPAHFRGSPHICWVHEWGLLKDIVAIVRLKNPELIGWALRCFCLHLRLIQCLLPCLHTFHWNFRWTWFPEILWNVKFPLYPIFQRAQGLLQVGLS
jgi:hypothetical protein